MKKTAKFFLIASPVIIAGLGGMGYYIYSKHKSSSFLNKVNNEFAKKESNNIYNKMKIFPEISTNHFYDYIRIKENQGIINDNMIAKIINYVISNMQVTGGEIVYGYQKISDQEVNFTFQWLIDNKTFSKNYKFKLLL